MTSLRVQRPRTILGARVIVGEQDPDVLTWLSFVLDGYGIDVVAAGTVGQVLTALERDGPFDAVVSDIALPGIDDQALGRLIRVTEKLPWILVDASVHQASLKSDHSGVVPLDGVVDALERALERDDKATDFDLGGSD